MNKRKKLIELEKQIREAMLGSDWQVRKELELLHREVIKELNRD